MHRVSRVVRRLVRATPKPGYSEPHWVTDHHHWGQAIVWESRPPFKKNLRNNECKINIENSMKRRFERKKRLAKSWQSSSIKNF